MHVSPCFFAFSFIFLLLLFYLLTHAFVLSSVLFNRHKFLVGQVRERERERERALDMFKSIVFFPSFLSNYTLEITATPSTPVNWLPIILGYIVLMLIFMMAFCITMVWSIPHSSLALLSQCPLIQKPFVPSMVLFSKATEMTSWGLMSVSPVDNVEIVLICL